jgi:GTP-binding protein HflX
VYRCTGTGGRLGGLSAVVGVVAASHSAKLTALTRKLFETNHFTVYESDDVAGVDRVGRGADAALGHDQVHQVADVAHRRHHPGGDDRLLDALDRRRIRHRISLLNHELENVRNRRRLQRIPRKRIPAQTIALVGYTNAGKSTLFNALCKTQALVSSLMFSTLDPTIRGLKLPDGRMILLADTVGFLNKLPHHLLAAFRSTLEEVTEADLLLHVIDSTSENPSAQIRSVHQVLEELNCKEKKQVYVFNKIDLLASTAMEVLHRLALDLPYSVEISALQGNGFQNLIPLIAERLEDPRIRIVFQLPYSESSLRALIHERGSVVTESFLPIGVRMEAFVDCELQYRLSSFRLDNEPGSFSLPAN